ncbi:MAG TPA: ABC transporter substrate-binding protein, partial [Polyangia bacterium]
MSGCGATVIMKKLAALALVLVVPSLAMAASGLGPMATLKQKNGEVDKLLRQKVEKGSPGEQKQKDDIKKMAAALLDYDELAQKALAAHWDKLTPAQRTEFVTTL